LELNKKLDCFVASAPRNDEKIRCPPPPPAVIPRASGVSSTPRLLDSITAASGILDRPPSRAMTTGSVAQLEAVIASAAKQSIAPRKGRVDCFVPALLAMTWLRFQMRLRIPAARDARGLAKTVRPAKQRAQGMPGAAAPAASRANVKWHTSVVTTGSDGFDRHSPRNGFTAYSALSPATNSSCHRHPRIKVLSAPVGPTSLREFSTSNGCQNHTASPSAQAPIILHAADRSRGSSRPAIAMARLTLLRPPHPAPRS
jgi:hypothetical protein